MDDFIEFETYVRRIERNANIYLVLLILAGLILLTAIQGIIYKSNWWILFFVLFVLLVVALRVFYKKAFSKKPLVKPFEIRINPNIRYADINCALKQRCDEGFDFTDTSAFFRTKNKYTVRIILYGTAEFIKKDYDQEKRRINSKANKLYNIKQSISIKETHKYMRVNLIYTEYLNNALYDYISTDAELMLTRVEGILNLVISNGKLIVPPINPTISIGAIKRYRDMFNMIRKMIGEE